MNKHTPHCMAIEWLYLSASEPGSHSPKRDIAGGLDTGDRCVGSALWILSQCCCLTNRLSKTFIELWFSPFLFPVIRSVSSCYCCFYFVTTCFLHVRPALGKTWGKDPFLSTWIMAADRMNRSLWRKLRTASSPREAVLWVRGAIAMVPSEKLESCYICSLHTYCPYLLIKPN